ncbi:MAG: hypothetical protein ACKO96_32500, partial [Flammeovirgaceae bacterium]
MKTADPSSFCAVGGYGFYKDHKTVFRVNGLKIETYPEIDSESFIVIDSSHATDKHAPFDTYWYGAVLSIEHKSYSEFFESNPQLSDYWYFKEKEKLKSTNAALMKNIGGNYFELNNEVYTRIIYDDDRGAVFKRIFNTIASEFKLLDY